MTPSRDSLYHITLSASSGLYFWPSDEYIPICLNKPSIPKVLASSGTIGTILSPIPLSFKRSVIILTLAMVVDNFLSPLPLLNLSKALLSASGKALKSSLLLGIGPPSFSLVFNKYWISGESFGGFT